MSIWQFAYIFSHMHCLLCILFISRYLPTERNRRKWMLEKKLRSSLLQIIQPRLASTCHDYGNDLLGLMLESCIATEQGGKKGDLSMSIDEIIHECKMFFFAGHDTTSLLLTWAVFLVSTYPEWQERLRKEVFREVGREQLPSADTLGKLKEARNEKILTNLLDSISYFKL